MLLLACTPAAIFAKLLLLLPALSSAAYVVPLPPGPYGVSIQDVLLTDYSQPDPYLNLTYRRVPVSVISSIGPSSSCEPVLQPYMPNATAKFWENAFAEEYNLPFFNHTLTETQLILCNAATHQSSSPNPVVLFAPGAEISRYFYNILGSYITAQTGYTVITYDFPGQTEIDQFPGGGVEYRSKQNTSVMDVYDMKVSNVVENGIIILDALLGRLSGGAVMQDNITASPALSASFRANISQVAIIGHSQGGSASLAALLADHRFLAGANMDGRLNGTETGWQAWVTADANPSGPKPTNDTTARPFLILEHQAHNQTNAAGWSVVWEDVLRGSKWQFEVKDSQHASFGDFKYLIDLYGIARVVSATAIDELVGSIAGATVMEVVTGLFAEFLGYAFGMATAEAVTRSTVEYNAFGLEVKNKTIVS